MKPSEISIALARKMVPFECLPVGYPLRAAVADMLEISTRREVIDTAIFAILPYFAERYLSTVLFEGLY